MAGVPCSSSQCVVCVISNDLGAVKVNLRYTHVTRIGLVQGRVYRDALFRCVLKDTYTCGYRIGLVQGRGHRDALFRCVLKDAYTHVTCRPCVIDL